MAALPAVLLAHQGGWDEFLLVATPIALIVGALMLVKRRVDAAADAQATPDPHGDPGSDRDAGAGDHPTGDQLKRR